MIKVYDSLLENIYDVPENGFMAFIDAPGGTGKTYTLNALLNRIRGNKDIGLASAFSGVAALLLKGGILIFNSLIYIFFILVNNFLI